MRLPGSTRGALLLIELYQRWARPVLPPACRFLPSCSDYGLLSIARHGLIRGGASLLARLLRCHPLSRGGYDPVH